MPVRFALTLALSCAVVPAVAGFDEALAAYQAGEFATARAEWQPLADTGDAEAQFYIGLMHAKGHGFPQSYDQALRWFKRAAASGHPRAQNNVGSYCLIGRGMDAPDPAEAVRWFRMSAEQGHLFAVNNLGRMYLRGEGVERDVVEAYVWLSIGAAAGVSKSQELLGELKGELTEEQMRRAGRLMVERRRAMNQASAAAQDAGHDPTEP